MDPVCFCVFRRWKGGFSCQAALDDQAERSKEIRTYRGRKQNESSVGPAVDRMPLMRVSYCDLRPARMQSGRTNALTEIMAVVVELRLSLLSLNHRSCPAPNPQSESSELGRALSCASTDIKQSPAQPIRKPARWTHSSTVRSVRESADFE
jgi:hypothetical protein